jgi:hypothetical protein
MQPLLKTDVFLAEAGFDRTILLKIGIFFTLIFQNQVKFLPIFHFGQQKRQKNGPYGCFSWWHSNCKKIRGGWYIFASMVLKDFHNPAWT